MNQSTCSIRTAGIYLALGVALIASVAGCEDRATETRSTNVPPAQAASAEAVPAAIVLAEAPAGAKDVAALKKEAKPGDEVVLRGRVGGSPSPFVEGRASFQLIDTSLKACGEGNPSDKCETPWDFCCEEAKEIAAHSASIQVVGADGKPLRAGMKGVGGLKPLSEVTVKGKVANGSDAGVLIVNATGIHVKG